MSKLKGRIRWDVTLSAGSNPVQWQSSLQARNGGNIQGIINWDGSGTFTATSSPAGLNSTSSTLKGAKNLFRKYLFTK